MQPIQIRTSLRQIVFLVALIFSSKKVSSQLLTTYQINANTCDCVFVTLQNNSHDTAYIISQSNSIHGWDSCFAYTVFKREYPKVGHSIDISYYYKDLDSYRENNFLYLLPGNSLTFGARTTDAILGDSLFVSMYMCPIPVSKEKDVSAIRCQMDKLKNTKEKMPWRWISYNCISK